MFRIGPFTVSGQLDLTSVVSAMALLIMVWRLLRHLARLDDRVETLWHAIIGNGPDDMHGLFARFSRVENQVADLWEHRKLGR